MDHKSWCQQKAPTPKTLDKQKEIDSAVIYQWGSLPKYMGGSVSLYARAISFESHSYRGIQKEVLSKW